MGRDAPDWDILPPADPGGTDPPPSKIIIPMAAQAPGYFVTMEGKIYRPLMVDADGRLVVTTQAADGSTIVVVCGGKDGTGAVQPILTTPEGCVRIAGVGYPSGTPYCVAVSAEGALGIAVIGTDNVARYIKGSTDAEIAIAGKDDAGAYKALLTTIDGYLRVVPAWQDVGRLAYDSNPAPHAWTTRATYSVAVGWVAVLQHVWVRVEPTTAAGDAEARIVIVSHPVIHVSSSITEWRDETASPHAVIDEGATIQLQTRNGDGVARQVSAAVMFVVHQI